MMKNKVVIFGVGAVLVSVLIAAGGAKRVVSADKKPPGDEGKNGPPVTAETANLDNSYAIPWSSVNGGGIDTAASSSYRTGLSVGQAAAGEASGPSYDMRVGFWHWFCFCGTKWGDTNNDIALNPADVVVMVQFVYKTLDLRVIPPGFACPYDVGDWNCDGFINPADVVLYVNCVYRSICSGDHICPNPCGP